MTSAATPSPDDTVLKGLVDDLDKLNASLGEDPAVRAGLEAHYGLRIKVLEQSLKRRDLLLQESVRHDESDIKDREIKLKEETSRREKWTNPLTVAVIVGALGLLANFANGLWSNLNERVKLQNDLIKEAIKGETEVERAKSLVFFANNKLISLDSDALASLVKSAGTDKPVPGSTSGAASAPQRAVPITFQTSIVNSVARDGMKGLPTDLPSLKPGEKPPLLAIVLHDAVGPDATEAMLRDGRADLKGPLAHWLIKSDGTVVAIAPETVKANHLGRTDGSLQNGNTVGVMVTGQPALTSAAQAEALVRLVSNISQRWKIPVDQIYSHAELAVPLGRKLDMLEQAPVVRLMVKAVRDAAPAPSATP